MRDGRSVGRPHRVFEEDEGEVEIRTEVEREVGVERPTKIPEVPTQTSRRDKLQTLEISTST